MKQVNMWRGALTDSAGLWDIAYISLAAVTALVLGSIVFVCAMSFADWKVCSIILDDHKLLQPCHFVADDIGSAIGKICVAYAAALGALAAYMAATRNAHQPPASGGGLLSGGDAHDHA